MFYKNNLNFPEVNKFAIFKVAGSAFMTYWRGSMKIIVIGLTLALGLIVGTTTNASANTANDPLKSCRISRDNVKLCDYVKCDTRYCKVRHGRHFYCPKKYPYLSHCDCKCYQGEQGATARCGWGATYCLSKGWGKTRYTQP